MNLRNRKPYAVYKRGKYYYCQFLLPDGTYSVARTTGETARGRAEAWATEYLQNTGGRVVSNNKITFESFSKDFFSWNGKYALDRRATGKRISERQCIDNQKQVEATLNPSFGKMKLTDINKEAIENFRNKLYADGVSSSRINKILYNLNTILESAYEKNLIPGLPKIEKVAKKESEEKGILSIEETKQLFSIEWPDYIAFAMNITAAATGLRRGELLAIQLKNHHGDYIDIDKSYDEFMKRLNETTKSGRKRHVIIPGRVSAVLTKLIEINPFKDNQEAFLFFSEIPGVPIRGEYVADCLYRALRKIGVSEAIRRSRHLTFHSWRAAFNSWLINARVPLEKVMRLTGHLSPEMAQVTYFRTDDLQDVKQIQESIFTMPEGQGSIN